MVDNINENINEKMLGKIFYLKIKMAIKEAKKRGIIKVAPSSLSQIASFVTFCRIKDFDFCDFSLIDENDIRVAASRVKTYGNKAFPVRKY